MGTVGLGVPGEASLVLSETHCLSKALLLLSSQDAISLFVYLVDSAEPLLWGQRGPDTVLTSEEAAGWMGEGQKHMTVITPGCCGNLKMMISEHFLEGQHRDAF